MRGGRHLPVLALVLAVSGCGDGALFGCDRRILSELASPQATHSAAVLEVACGATARDAYWVLLTRADRGFSYDRDRIAVFEGRPPGLEWRGDALQVNYGSARPFLLRAESDGVRIVYVGTAPDR